MTFTLPSGPLELPSMRLVVRLCFHRLGKGLSLGVGSREIRSIVDPVQLCFDQRPFTLGALGLEIGHLVEEAVPMLLFILLTLAKLTSLPQSRWEIFRTLRVEAPRRNVSERVWLIRSSCLR